MAEKIRRTEHRMFKCRRDFAHDRQDHSLIFDSRRTLRILRRSYATNVSYFRISGLIKQYITTL